MFNFTKAETNAVLFTVIILLISGIYQLISPTKSLQPSYDYSASDSIFKRLSQEKPKSEIDSNQTKPANIENKYNQIKTKKKVAKYSIKKEKLLPASININTASEKELQKLPRIGPAMSKRIIEYRNGQGNFKKADDLLQVRGIGKKTLEKLKPFIVIN